MLKIDQSALGIIPGIKEYSLIFLSVASAAFLRWLLIPVLGWHTPYLTFLLAVVYGAWMLGFAGGAAATAMSIALAAGIIVYGRSYEGAGSPTEVVGLLLFVTEALAISMLGQSQLIEKRRGQASAEEAQSSARSAEESLAILVQSEARNAAGLEFAMDCIITMDQRGRIKEFNPAAEQTFGYDRDEVLGKAVTDVIIAPPTPGQTEWCIEHYLATGTQAVAGTRVEVTAIRHDRSEFPVEIAFAHASVSGQLEVTAYLRDISERKLAADGIRQTALRQRAFVREVLLNVTQGRLILCSDEIELPPTYAPLGDPIALSSSFGMSELRRSARRAADRLGIAEDRVFDLLTATSEAAMNAIVHVGAGIGEVSANDASGVAQVRITDKGRGISLENLPRATLRKGYTTAGTLGQGMKLMLETADRVFLQTGDRGTTVVIEQDRVPANINWLLALSEP